MTDFLDEKLTEINNRLADLQPLVDEYHTLETAIAALDGIDRAPAHPAGSGTTATPASSNPPSTPRPGAKRKRRRRKRVGKRTAQALNLIRANPGITISMMSHKMHIKANYLYKVLPPLEQAGEIRKQGRGWFPGAA